MADRYNNSAERRKTKRIKADFFLLYRQGEPIEISLWMGDKEFPAKMLDLSENGMAIKTNYNILALTTLLIRFTLINLHADAYEEARPMHITGEVKYNNALSEGWYRLGVSFTQIAEEDKSAIANFKKMAMGR
ncbi:PilZ domain-containing protein [Candidatus Omnitrophota bacterium]